MLCVQEPAAATHRGSYATFFASSVASQLAIFAEDLPSCIARCGGRNFVGAKHARVVARALELLRKRCDEAANGPVDDVEVLCMCLERLLDSSGAFNMESVFNTGVMSPHEPLGNQDRASWLLLKAVFSIDDALAGGAVRALARRLPGWLGLFGVFALLMQTPFGLAFLRWKPQEGNMPVAHAVFECEHTRRLLSKSLEKLERSRREECEQPVDQPADDWEVLRGHVLHTVEMAQAVVCRRRTTTVVLLRLHTQRGLVCFARRLRYNGGAYREWARQCADDLSRSSRRALEAASLELCTPRKEECERIREAALAEGLWDAQCVDDTSSSNAVAVRAAEANDLPCFLQVEGTFRDFVIVSFVSFVEE